VYKGIVAGTGELVAVKRAQEGSIQGAQEFKNEIELLSRVHHRNLVSLVGFCYEQGEQMLIYEFMPNGTVTEWLRGELLALPDTATLLPPCIVILLLYLYI
jgi:serine/threonine protein kinase